MKFICNPDVAHQRVRNRRLAEAEFIGQDGKDPR